MQIFHYIYILHIKLPALQRKNFFTCIRSPRPWLSLISGCTPCASPLQIDIATMDKLANQPFVFLTSWLTH